MGPVDFDVEAGGVTLRARSWDGAGHGFLLVHGLASNARTWDLVAERLAGTGHRVVAYDQRGHGRSEVPEQGYDLATSIADLLAVLDTAGMEAPVLAGQSWGGNLALGFAASHPGRVGAVAGVDGGAIDLPATFATWEDCADQLRPPQHRATLAVVENWIRDAHPDWSDAAVAATLGNLTVDGDGRARNRLPLEAHMSLLRAMWENPPSRHYPVVSAPALLVLAEAADPAWATAKRRAAESALEMLRRGTVTWVEGDHDLHLHRPDLVAAHLADPNWRT